MRPSIIALVSIIFAQDDAICISSGAGLSPFFFERVSFDFMSMFVSMFQKSSPRFAKKRTPQ